MKTNNQLSDECFKLFTEQHSELACNFGNLVNQIMAGEKATYTKVAIQFAIQFMQDEIALKKRTRK